MLRARTKHNKKLSTSKVDGSVRKSQPVRRRCPAPQTTGCGAFELGHNGLESSYTIHGVGRNTNDSEASSALFCSEGSISQPPSEHSHDINPPQSEDELPSLESLLRYTPKSTIQIQGWKEIVGPDGPILEELPEHVLETLAPRTNDTENEQWLMTGSGKPKSVPHNRPAPKASSRAKRLRRGAQARRIPKKQRLDTREQAELKEAKIEWARCGYPKICWRGLSSRLEKFSPALCDILNGNSPSFYRTELELAITREEDRKYRCMENSTAGYYGPRGQQILVEHILAVFKPELHRRAVSDRLISSGLTYYVITVLIPELAVMLIQEDMKVCDETARQILKVSAYLGEILHY